LVVADRDDAGLVEQDVARHQHRIGEEAGGDELLAFALVLELRHAAELPEPGDGREQPGRLGMRGHVALREQHAAIRVETGGEEQRGQIERLVVQILRVVVGRDRVQVDDAEERVVRVRVLRRDVLAHRADVIADVFGTRGLDAGEDAHGLDHLVWSRFNSRRTESADEAASSAGLRLARGATANGSLRRRSRWQDRGNGSHPFDLEPRFVAGEARALRDNLAKAIDRRAFLLQAGDCVESFNEISTMRIREKLKIMLQMSAVLTYGATLPVVKVGRIAGQFTKPRSDATETVAGEEIPS